MDEAAAKRNLHSYLRHERAAVLAKLDGLPELDVRRPMTVTGTNLLGLVKHLGTWEARYLGECFGRPFPEALPDWRDEDALLADLWAREDESRAEVVDRYRRVWAHADATVDTLDLDAVGHVAWWGDGGADVPLFDVLVHLLAETGRHAGHADILREQLDGAVGTDARAMAEPERDAASWAARWAVVDAAALAGHRRWS